jgi:hypothetical protein
VASEPYRTPPAGLRPDPYLAAWAAFRSRRRAKWILFFAWWFVAKYLTGMFVGAHLLSGDHVLYGYVVIGLAVFAWMGYLSLLDCPRCGARMFIFGLWGDRHGDGCSSCDLPLGTPKYPAEDTPK